MEVLPLILSLISTIPIFFCGYKFYHHRKSKLKLYLSASTIKLFYPSSAIKTLLRDNNYKNLPDSTFIDYSIALKKGYYQNDILKLDLSINGNIVNTDFPYKEIINYTRNPNIRIHIERQIDSSFQLNEYINKKTQQNLNDYLLQKPKTTNGQALRISSFSSTSDKNVYLCTLQSATYYDQIRTNLTLDVPLLDEGENTIRIMDLSQQKSLKPFEDSIMANTIGVSTIWYMNNKKGDKKNKLQFFLKPRQTQIGVFTNMLGTVSGVVEPISRKNKIKTLEEHVTNEILREFFEETGFDRYMSDNNIAPSQITITPLAFCRELTRGGKPQFFFLIKTPHVTESDFYKYFKQSVDGKNEFKDEFLTKLPNYSLSPEVVMNYIYAFQYLQKERFDIHKYIDLDP